MARYARRRVSKTSGGRGGCAGCFMEYRSESRTFSIPLECARRQAMHQWRSSPDYDSAVVERLKAAGAIILGKTTTTEFALLAPTPTRNPWNLEHTPGGSSSGSGAAVAARMCPAALGSQTGG